MYTGADRYASPLGFYPAVEKPYKVLRVEDADYMKDKDFNGSGALPLRGFFWNQFLLVTRIAFPETIHRETAPGFHPRSWARFCWVPQLSIQSCGICRKDDGDGKNTRKKPLPSQVRHWPHQRERK